MQTTLNPSNEKTFVYGHYESVSWMFLVMGAVYSLIAASIKFTTTELSLIIFTIMLAFLSSLLPSIRFLFKNRHLSQKEQSQIIKKHRYSLKWGFLTITLCLSITYFISLIFEVRFQQPLFIPLGVFMLVHFVALRIWLKNLKKRIV